MAEQLQLGDSVSLVTLKKAWDQALVLLEPEINRPSFASFVQPARPLSIDGSKVVIGATTDLGKIFLLKYTHLVKLSLDSILKADLEISVEIAPPETAKPKTAERKPEPAARVIGTVSSISMPLNDKYTFESFITGPANRMAHAIAQSVAEKPGEVYNPVFLYGGPGLGKTHLLHAIGNYVITHHPTLRVAYVSGEHFTSHFVMAVRDHRSEDFRKKYRNIDIWLVDDIQFLAGKERTNEEFFHTFNALYQTNKQIVLTSDRSPKDLLSIEERMKSRFESGIMTDVAPPDLETRIAILQRKAIQEKADIPPFILERVAEVVHTNIRALEGALVTLMAYSSLMKVSLSEELVDDVLSRYLSEKKCAELSPDDIQRSVAKAFNLEVSELKSKKRTNELVTARHIAMYLCRELTDTSLPKIGKAFGDRNHTTVIHACTHAKELLDNNPSLKSTVEGLHKDLKSGVV